MSRIILALLISCIIATQSAALPKPEDMKPADESLVEVVVMDDEDIQNEKKLFKPSYYNVANPGLVNPGLVNPGLVNPGLVNPLLPQGNLGVFVPSIVTQSPLTFNATVVLNPIG